MTSKNQYIILSALALIISFLIPFLFRGKCDSFLTVFEMGLACVGTVATIITLFIAIQLYDRFGLGNRFIERRTDKVLELVDFLKGRTFIAHLSRGYSCYIRPNPDHLTMLLGLKTYPLGFKKEIIINVQDYSNTLKKFFELKRSYWLPNEIKDKMAFLEIVMIQKDTVGESEEYARIQFGAGSTDDYVRVQPRRTVEEFINKYHELVREIEKWLADHSDIILDLRLEEPGEQEN